MMARALLGLVRGVHGSSTARVEPPQVPVPMLKGAKGKRRVGLVSTHDLEIYPLSVCLAMAVGLHTFGAVRNLALNPDVNLRRRRRETPTWERFELGETEPFTRSRHRLSTMRANPINTHPAFAKLLQEGDKK